MEVSLLQFLHVVVTCCGGHYVPELARRVLDGNAAGNKKINLKGFMVGNAWTYMVLFHFHSPPIRLQPIDNAGAVFYWWTHALISDDSYEGMMKNCDFAHIGPLKLEESLFKADACQNYINQAMAEMGDINVCTLLGLTDST